MAATYTPGKSLATMPDASYQRMLAAGMPTGGIDVYRRTMAEQQALYNAYKAGKGPVAAKPSASAPHIRGYAMDAHTTTSGKYDPSAAHRWLTKGGDGSSKPKAGEKLQCHDYGWRRTVPSERWHFGYDVALDKVLWRQVQKALGGLTVDGIPGPKTLTALKKWQKKQGLTADGIPGPATLAKMAKTPAPKPVKVPTLGRFGVMNCGAWGKTSLPSKTITALKALIKKIDASIYALTECPEWLRTILRAAMPGGTKRWLVVVRGSQAILFDSAKWKLVSTVPAPSMTFGPTSYHGGLYATLQQTTTKARLTFGSYHLPPNSVSSESYQKAKLKAFAAKITSRPALIGGDGADSGTWIDWDDARIKAKASPNREAPTYGKTIKDRAHSRGLTIRKYAVIDSKGASDHEGVLVQYTIPA